MNKNCKYCGRNKVTTELDKYHPERGYVSQCCHCGERTDAFPTPAESIAAFDSGQLFDSMAFRQLRNPLVLDAIPDKFILNMLIATYELWADDMRYARKTGKKKACEELLEELDGSVITAVVDAKQLLRRAAA